MTEIERLREALLPCPFCGAHGEEIGLNRPTFANNWFIRCYVCGTESAEQTTKAAVIAAWNRRAALAATPPGAERWMP